MAKKVLFDSVIVGQQTFGRKARAQDFLDMQRFAHESTEQVTTDFLASERTVSGFDFAFADTGNTNTRNLTILAPGRVYEADGRQYELAANTPLTIAPADLQFSRIDLIVAVIEADFATTTETIPFVRVRTQTELEAGAAAFAPTQLQQPTRSVNRAVVQLRQGTPGDNFSFPVLASNEVLLYVVNVPVKTTGVRQEDLSDVRPSVRKLKTVDDAVDVLLREVDGIDRRLGKFETDLANQNVDLTPIFGSIKTLGEIISDLNNRVNSLNYSLPEIPTTLAPSSPAGGKLQSTGNLDASTPVVDIELGSSVKFGDKEVVLSPSKFPPEVNARFAQIAGGTSNERLESLLTLNNVRLLDSDGGADFALRNAQFPTARSRPAVAARDARFVEIYGGLAADNSSFVGEWTTYDSDSDTLTARSFTGIAPPNCDRPALFPCGNGTDMLLVAGASNTQNPRWFRFNAVTRACVEKTNNLPTGVQFFGDLIAPGIVFIVALRKIPPGYTADYWKYETATDSFTQLGVFGNPPTVSLDAVHGCTLEAGKFVAVAFDPNVSASGKTHVFDYASLTWTQLNIPAPYGQGVEKQLPLSRFRLANVNGRVRLIGGLLAKPTDLTKGRIWELVRQSSPTDGVGDIRFGVWKAFEGTFPPVQDAGFCGTLRDGLAIGKAFLFAGAGGFSEAKQAIYTSVQGGLVAAAIDEPGVISEQGISLADGSTFASFELPTHITPWDVGAYFFTVAGRFDKGEVKLEASFDSGLTWSQYRPSNTTSVAVSGNPGDRRLRITLYGFGKVKPILTRLNEIFDADGVVLKERVVLRYNAVTTGVRALYADRDGKVTIESAVVPSTTTKALLQKVSPQGAAAPIVKNYINKRHAHLRYQKTVIEGDPTSTVFENELAVDASWVDAYAVSASNNTIYKIVSPAVAFDAPVQIIGVEVGDDWTVELEA